MRIGDACRAALLAWGISAAFAPVVAQEAEPTPTQPGVTQPGLIEPGPTGNAPLELRSIEDEPIATAPISPNPLAGLDLEALKATREMPLFTPSRTAPVVEAFVETVTPPAETEPDAQIAAPPEPPPLRLIGVLMMGAEQVAILANEGTGEIQRLRPGEAYEDWTLRIVDTRTVAFESGDQRHEFKMFEPGTNASVDPGTRTPVPEEALQNPGALLGGGANAPEGEYNQNFDPEQRTQEGGVPSEAELERNTAPQAPGESEGIPEGTLDDSVDPQSPEAQKPPQGDSPQNTGETEF